MTTQEVFKAALALPDEDRERLRDELEESLKASRVGARLAADKEFMAEMHRRQEAFRSGSPGIPADEVFDELLSE